MNENKMSEESFFSFTLGRGIFSVPVRYVKEVFTFEEITPIPNSLDYMKGVMNVRGSVVSIADFRLLFGFNPSSDLSETQVIILGIPQVNDKYVLLGILADKVDVVSPLRMIQADSKDYGIPEDKAHFINAVARRDDEFILILSPERILSFIEYDVEKAAEKQINEKEI